MPFMVLEVAATPNPLAKKFTLDRPLGDSPRSYFTADTAKGDPIAAALFAIEGVGGVFLLRDFLTVTKTEAAKWSGIVSRVKAALKKTP